MSRTAITGYQLFKIARALRERYPCDCDWEDLPQCRKKFWLTEARELLRHADIESD